MLIYAFFIYTYLNTMNNNNDEKLPQPKVCYKHKYFFQF